MIVKNYYTGPLDVNTYVLKDEKSKEAALIDVGGNFEEIKAETEKDGYKIKFVLNTHGHYDHVAGEAVIINKYPEIPVYMHKDDLIHVKNMPMILAQYGYDPAGLAFEPTGFIDENTELFLGENKIKIFRTPGHSKGSLSYYVDGKLFSGDALFKHSIGRTDFFDGDFDTLINSIKTKLLTLDDNTVIYTGHGEPTAVKEEKKFNIYIKN